MAPPSQDRCHRALLVLDIVFHIFEQAMYDTEGGQKTLARLSRTCRAWKEPGYDVLWRDANLIAALRVLAPMNIVTVEDAELIDEDEEMGLALSRTSYYVSYVRSTRCPFTAFHVNFVRLSSNSRDLSP